MSNQEMMLQPTMAGLTARIAHYRASPRAKSAMVQDGQLHLKLATGATVVYPTQQLRLLAGLTEDQLAKVVTASGGTALMWPQTEGQISIGVAGLLRHIGPREYDGQNVELMMQPTMAGFAARMAHHRNKVKAKAARVRDGILEIELLTGATVSVPARQLRHLAHLSDEQIERVRLTGGDTLMWRDANAERSTDVDLGVDSLLQALTGLQTHREIASKGGSARTPAKAAASRENGKKGGRPRKNQAPTARDSDEV